MFWWILKRLYLFKWRRGKWVFEWNINFFFCWQPVILFAYDVFYFVFFHFFCSFLLSIACNLILLLHFIIFCCQSSYYCQPSTCSLVIFPYFFKTYFCYREKTMKLIDIYDICKNREQLLEKLREWQLIPTNYNCPNCGNAMKLLEAADRPDGWQWFCNAKISIRKQAAQPCHTRVEFRAGTLFERSKLSIFQATFYTACLFYVNS